MARHEITDASERILQATLEVAGNGVRGSFSTLEIAEKAGVSEFTVFSRYKNKDRLLEAANDFCFESYFGLLVKATKRHKGDLEGLFNEIIDALLKAPSLVRFSGTYALIFPRQGDIEKYDQFFLKLKERFSSLEPVVPLRDNLNNGYLICYMVQEVVQDALYIISGEIPDNEASRKTMYSLFSRGAGVLLKV